MRKNFNNAIKANNAKAANAAAAFNWQFKRCVVLA